jgi:CBS domain containing-hemolysin-like protein
MVQCEAMICCCAWQGALDMRYKKVVDAMTPLESVYMLDVTRRVDWATMREVSGR